MHHLGIDLGTGSVKVLCLSEEGEEKSASAPYPVLTPRSGFAETPTEEWIRAIRECLTALGPFEGPLTMGFSGQMHGITPCAGGKALHPAILWNDTRAVSYLSTVNEQDTALTSRLMNRPTAGMGLFSILWLKDHLPEMYDRTEVFLQPKDYVRYYLTGEAATDPSDGGATLLYDFREGRWASEILSGLGIDSGKLPPVKNSFTPTAPLLPERAAALGLPEGTELRIGAADTACALLGNDIAKGDLLQLSIGTGAQIVEFTGTLPEYSPFLNTYPAADRGWYVMSAHLNGGTFLEWLRKILRFDWKELYAELESRPLAEWLEELGDLTFRPYINGERSPLMDPDLSGSLDGLKAHHTRTHIILAALLGTLFALRLGLEKMGNKPLMATGGSFSHPWWSQLTATVLDRPLTLSERLNASAWGAALIGAGKESGFYKRFHHRETGETISPDAAYRKLLYGLYEKYCAGLRHTKGSA